MKISGIYKIQSIVKPERCYIGSAVNIKSRWESHLRTLRNGKHHSLKLQRHFDKHGEEDLIFIIIEPCFPQFLICREQSYIDSLKPYFNICMIAGSSLGIHFKIRQKKILSIEHKKNISIGNIGKIGHWRGKKGPSPSEEGRLRRNKLLVGNTFGLGNKGNSGRKFSEDFKHKKREMMIGNAYAKGGKSRTGQHVSEEQKAKQRATWEKKKINKSA